jgi:hypothetical protein
VEFRQSVRFDLAEPNQLCPLLGHRSLQLKSTGLGPAEKRCMIGVCRGSGKWDLSINCSLLHHISTLKKLPTKETMRRAEEAMRTEEAVRRAEEL